MRIAVACLSSVFACACASPDGADLGTPESAASRLTLERILSRPSLTGTAPTAPTWSPDSRFLAFRWNDAAGPRREIWLVEADGGGLRRLTSESEGGAGVSDLAWTADGAGIVYLRAGGLWRTDLIGASARIAPLGEGATDLAVSPDGRYASALVDGDLWLVDLTDGAVRRATHVGEPSISAVPLGRYRRPDVEIGPYVWGGPTYAWAPDSRTIAVHHVDRRAVRTVPFPHYLGDDTDPNPVRRAYPGDPNERRALGLLDVETGALELLDLPDPTATRIAGFSWSREGRLLVDRESDTAVDRWLHVLDPGSGQWLELFHDRRETRVYTTTGSAWHPDGRHVVVLGDLDDRYGLYALNLERPRTAAAAPDQPGGSTSTGGPLVTADRQRSSTRRTSRAVTSATSSATVARRRAAGRPASRRLPGSKRAPIHRPTAHACRAPALQRRPQRRPSSTWWTSGRPRRPTTRSSSGSRTRHRRSSIAAAMGNEARYVTFPSRYERRREAPRAHPRVPDRLRSELDPSVSGDLRPRLLQHGAQPLGRASTARSSRCSSHKGYRRRAGRRAWQHRLRQAPSASSS